MNFSLILWAFNLHFFPIFHSFSSYRNFVLYVLGAISQEYITRFAPLPFKTAFKRSLHWLSFVILASCFWDYFVLENDLFAWWRSHRLVFFVTQIVEPDLWHFLSWSRPFPFFVSFGWLLIVFVHRWQTLLCLNVIWHIQVVRIVLVECSHLGFSCFFLSFCSSHICRMFCQILQNCVIWLKNDLFKFGPSRLVQQLKLLWREFFVSQICGFILIRASIFLWIIFVRIQRLCVNNG